MDKNYVEAHNPSTEEFTDPAHVQIDAPAILAILAILIILVANLAILAILAMAAQPN